MEIKKGSKIELFAPVMKAHKGNKREYLAVLSDDSMDRDEERLSKGCIEKLSLGSGYIAGLIDHDNSVMKQVAEWVNKEVTTIDGRTALIAEPRFFKSNPNSKIIKGMLDEGAKIGVSIGAIVKNFDDVDGTKVFTELELLEASFVAIASNRHAKAVRVAKSYNENKEAIKVEKEFTQKDIDSAIEKKAEEIKADFQKKLESKDAELSKMKTEFEESVKGNKAEKDKIVELTKTLTETKEALEKEKKDALEKQQFADKGGEKGMKPEDVDKAFSEGKLPIMRG